MYNLILTLLVLFGTFILPDTALSQNYATVEKIVDGDTIWATLNSEHQKRAFRIRLIGVDTLEVDGGEKAKKDSIRLNASQAKMKSGGIEAKNFLLNKIPRGSIIELIYDQVKYDKYGRTLAYVYSSSGEFINKSLIENGLAGLLIYSPNDSKAQELFSALQNAKSKKVGLWGKGYRLTERWKK